MTRENHYDILTLLAYGGVAEWFKAPVLKTGDSARDRGFESHLLRQILKKELLPGQQLFFQYLAEEVGFEPTVPCGIASFQDWCLKPLGHPSIS